MAFICPPLSLFGNAASGPEKQFIFLKPIGTH
jgi:hypothetical protein